MDISRSCRQALLGAALAVFATQVAAQTSELIEGIAAIVDEGVVLKSELDFRTDIVTENFRQQQAQLPLEQRGQLPPRPVLEQQVLDQLITKELQLQRAERIGIVVGDDLLNQALANVASGLGLTLEEMPTALADEGIEYEMYRQEAREDIILNQLEQRDVLARISVSPRELERCLARTEETETDSFDYNVSHILISVPRDASSAQLAEAQATAESIIAQLEAGTDFGQLAITYSDSPTALDGGSLGWRKGAQLPTLFAEDIVRMEPGEISEPIQSASGIHIVRLNEMRGGERIMVDQVRARHILMSPNELLDSDATYQKILAVYEQIMAGEDFATLATSLSEDTVSAADGGDLGWTEPDTFVPEFAEVLNSLEIGEVSEPVQTRFGWHIIEVLDRRSYDTTDDRKEQNCQQQIRVSKAEEERQMWIQQLRDEAFIEKRL
jgi:peptidyl-prolyl cis-trans isomerase SurA